MKKLILFPLLLLVFYSFSQSLKPVAQMVANAAQSSAPHYETSLFAKNAVDAAQLPELTAVVQAGLLLDWDQNQVTNLRAQEGAWVSISLPFENNTTISLELVPARNFTGDFQVHRAATGEVIADVDKGTHYWGVVNGDSESLVTLSVFENEIIGLITTSEGRFSLGAIQGRSDKKHILYRNSDLKQQEGFTCETDDELHRIGEAQMEAESRAASPDNCVRMFIETDYTLFQNKGSVANVVSYMTAVMSQVSALYTNESVNLSLHDLNVWDVNDPYTGPASGDYLTQFRNAKNGVFNGDLAHLVGIHNLGGIAYLDVLCNGYYSVGYSSINATYSNVPTYSWTVEVMTHEMGHNLGSSHTHACVWNGNNTAIDGCGPTAGYSEGCTAALPTGGGTIMSYCHLVSGVGINFNNGFGPQPGDRIRSEVYNAACLAPCGGGSGGCSYTTINSNGFDSNWGIWTDGGTDCARVNSATYANSPTYSIRLRDNTSTSVMTTSSQNWSSYDEITVQFSFITVSFENGEDFWVQISNNGGATYTTVADFNAGAEFVNGTRYTGTVVVPGPFASNSRLRFRADASADDDQIYIDDVVITGCQQNFSGQVPERTNYAVSTDPEEIETRTVSNLRTGPNPTSSIYNILFEAGADMEVEVLISDLSGRLALRNTFTASAGENQLSLPVGELSNGIYLVNIRAGEDSFTEKMIIAK